MNRFPTASAVLALLLTACESKQPAATAPGPPTAADATKPAAASTATPDLAEVFRRRVATFPTATLPVAFSPDDDPRLGSSCADCALTDSLFIVRFVDEHQYDEPPGDRTYGYHQGRKVFETPTVLGIVYPFGFSVGQEYRLYTYRKDQPAIIDSLMLAIHASDSYERFGRLDRNLIIRRKTNEFGYDTVKQDVFVRRTVLDSFRVAPSGLIEKL